MRELRSTAAATSKVAPVSIVVLFVIALASAPVASIEPGSGFDMIPGPLAVAADDAVFDDELADFANRALSAALGARESFFGQAGSTSRLTPAGGIPLTGALGKTQDWTAMAVPVSAPLTIGGTSDEPSGTVRLTTDPELSCPGFYVLRTHAGPASQAGRFGAELKLVGSGKRTLQGGLNFGGRASASIRGFSAFNIANPSNEPQVVNIGVTVGAPGRVVMERRSGGEVVDTPVDGDVEAGESQASVVVPPGFYVVTFTPFTNASTSYAVSALTSFTDRSGGGFQGGVVVGGLHDPQRASGSRQSTGFAGFCLARDFDVTTTVQARPTFGSSGSTGMAFSISRGDGVVFLDSRDGDPQTVSFEPEEPWQFMQWHLNSTGEVLIEGLPSPAAGADVNLSPLWQNCPSSGCQGSGVLVAVVDDGLEIGHPDLIDNMSTNVPHRDFLGPADATAQDPAPRSGEEGHGTSVAGLIAARDNQIGVLGIASRASLIGINLLQSNSSANDAEAMVHAGGSVSVSNNSWGAPDGFGFLNPSDDTWKQAVEQGISQGFSGRGIVYLWAGGNGHEPPENDYFSDYSSIDGQANYHGVFAIASLNANDRRSSYSELGSNVLVSGFGGEFCGVDELTMATTDLSQPGWGYNHPEAETADIELPDPSYTRCFNGTSSATPVVAGVVALMREANPELTWREIRWILAQSARRVDPQSPLWAANGVGLDYNPQYGFGAVDAAASVAIAREVTGALPDYRAENSSAGQTGSIGGGQAVSATAEFSSNTLNRLEFVNANIELIGGSENFDSGDLQLVLTSPSGTTALLTPKRRCTTVIDEESGEKQQVFCEQNLVFSFGAVQFLGENPNGVWTLGIDASASTESVTLNQWFLTFYGHQGE